MEIRNKKIRDAIEKLIDTSDEFYDNKKYKESIAKSLEAWKMLPDPKESHDESFHIARGIADSYFLVKDYEQAIFWAKKLAECDPERLDDGDSELLLGKVYFETDRLEEAKINLKIAYEKSEGRIFEYENKKYLNLLKK